MTLDTAAMRREIAFEEKAGAKMTLVSIKALSTLLDAYEVALVLLLDLRKWAEQGWFDNFPEANKELVALVALLEAK